MDKDKILEKIESIETELKELRKIVEKMDITENAPEEFKIENGVLLEYMGTRDTVMIPKGIKEIGEKAFYNQREIKTVVIQNGVTKIANDAFCNCKKLTEVVFPDTLTEIGAFAFAYCESLDFVDIPESVREIGEYAFAETYADIIVPHNCRWDITTFEECFIVHYREKEE